jgi:hypothetical protein
MRVAVPILELLIERVAAVDRIEGRAGEHQHAGQHADADAVRILGETSIGPVHRHRAGLHEDHGVVEEAERLAVAPHGEVGRDLAGPIGGVPRMLTLLHALTKLAKAGRHLDRIGDVLEAVEQLGGRVEHRPIVDALAAVVTFQVASKCLLVEKLARQPAAVCDEVAVNSDPWPNGT